MAFKREAKRRVGLCKSCVTWLCCASRYKAGVGCEEQLALDGFVITREASLWARMEAPEASYSKTTVPSLYHLT